MLYYVRAYATNESGTGYGNEISFVSGTVTDVDENIYHIVSIGNQIWMVENLKTTKYNDGSTIPHVTDSTLWEQLTSPAYCWFDNHEMDNKDTYGALYNYYAVETEKLCPKGWHVQTDYEWLVLTEFLGGASLRKVLFPFI